MFFDIIKISKVALRIQAFHSQNSQEFWVKIKDFDSFLQFIFLHAINVSKNYLFSLHHALISDGHPQLLLDILQEIDVFHWKISPTLYKYFLKLF